MPTSVLKGHKSFECITCPLVFSLLLRKRFLPPLTNRAFSQLLSIQKPNIPDGSSNGENVTVFRGDFQMCDVTLAGPWLILVSQRYSSNGGWSRRNLWRRKW